MRTPASANRVVPSMRRATARPLSATQLDETLATRHAGRTHWRHSVALVADAHDGHLARVLARMRESAFRPRAAASNERDRVVRLVAQIDLARHRVQLAADHVGDRDERLFGATGVQRLGADRRQPVHFGCALASGRRLVLREREELPPPRRSSPGTQQARASRAAR
jgi:hypothetical protein